MAEHLKALEDLAPLIQLCDRLADEGAASMYHPDTLAQRNAAVRRLRDYINASGVQPSADARDAARWRWARSVLLSISYLSGPHGANETNVCPIGEANRPEFWDLLADTARKPAAGVGGNHES